MKKEYVSPEIQKVNIQSKEAFTAYSGCLADTFHSEGLGTPVCNGGTPDHKDGDCYYTPHE